MRSIDRPTAFVPSRKRVARTQRNSLSPSTRCGRMLQNLNPYASASFSCRAIVALDRPRDDGGARGRDEEQKRTISSAKVDPSPCARDSTILLHLRLGVYHGDQLECVATVLGCNAGLAVKSLLDLMCLCSCFCVRDAIFFRSTRGRRTNRFPGISVPFLRCEP
jgi:hypothetical protein